MRKLAGFLLIASRFLAIIALLVGVGAGLLGAVTGGFVCFDNCPEPGVYFANQGPITVRVMTPCIVLEMIALLLFLAYCVSTRQGSRAIRQVIVLLVVGLVGVVALYFFMLHGQASLPLTQYDSFQEGPLVAWEGQWGLALAVAAGAWSGILAYLQWAAE
jgi:hypothetical protein